MQAALNLVVPAGHSTHAKSFVVAQEHFTPNFVFPLLTALHAPVNGASVHTLDEHVFHVGDPEPTAILLVVAGMYVLMTAIVGDLYVYIA